MAKVLNFGSEIASTLTIEPYHVKQSVDAFTGAEAYDITISGSLVTTGSIKGTTTLTIGSSHTNNGLCSTIGGGSSNGIATGALNAFIGGGCSNIVDNSHSSIVGGDLNEVSGTCSFIGGGGDNTTGYNNYITVVGGQSNMAQASHTFIGGGRLNGINDVAEDSSIVGGRNNCISSNTSGVFIGGGANNCICNERIAYTFIGGGENNYIDGGATNENDYSVIVGGCLNKTEGACSFIGAGKQNKTENIFATVVGGTLNTGSGAYSFIGGGQDNIASGSFSTVGSGFCNITNARYSTIGGGHRNIIQSLTDECYSRGVTIGGGIGHNSSGGTLDTTTGDLCGEITCCNAGRFSTIGGGLRNCATGIFSTVGGGRHNTVSHSDSFAIGSNLTSDKACTTFMNNVHITGSTTADGILQLSRRDTTPTGVEGMIIASGSAGASKLYYYNGSTWNALF
jgi:hypothetical protein